MKPSFKNKGITLIEIIVVLAIFALVVAIGLVVNFRSFTSGTFQSEETKIVSLLEKARSRSMANYYDSAHGVCYIDPNYIIFREDDGHCVNGASSNELIPANINIANISDLSDMPVVFDQLSGNTTPALIRVTSDGTNYKDININNEGRINW